MKLTDLQKLAIIVMNSVIDSIPTTKSIQVYMICSKIVGPKVMEYFKNEDIKELQEQCNDFFKRILKDGSIDNANSIDPMKKPMSKKSRFSLYEKGKEK